MDFLRLILPQIISLFSFFVLFWLMSYFIKKEVSADVWKTAAPWIQRVLIAIVVIFILWMAEILSVNEIPRSALDNSVKQNMSNSYETRMQKDTTKK